MTHGVKAIARAWRLYHQYRDLSATARALGLSRTALSRDFKTARRLGLIHGDPRATRSTCRRSLADIEGAPIEFNRQISSFEESED